jgi:hypothetical protein
MGLLPMGPPDDAYVSLQALQEGLPELNVKSSVPAGQTAAAAAAAAANLACSLY